MELEARIESALHVALARVDAKECPPRLREATRHAVFPGGARVRPRLCLSVAAACAEDDPALTDGAAAAIELLHCASLVHDDLPCFDDSALRRGAPSVHEAFGEPLAVLAGDGLIVLAFQTLAAGAHRSPARLVPLMGIIGDAVGPPAGIVCGQAMECERDIRLSDYHHAKTGALFSAATMLGAAAAGADPLAWRMLGRRIGKAYQIVDDIRDAICSVEQLGKPCGQDERLDRPSSARAIGIVEATTEFDALVADIVDAVPDCPGAAALRRLIVDESQFLFPTLPRVSAA